MPTVKQFEDYLISLSDDDHDKLVQERIQRLNADQQVIAQARELERKELRKITHMMEDPDPDVQEFAFNSILHMTKDACEHVRSYAKHCSECGKMDHIMFPELFNEFGESIEDE